MEERVSFLPEERVKSKKIDSKSPSIKIDLSAHCLKETPDRTKIPTPPPPALRTRFGNERLVARQGEGGGGDHGPDLLQADSIR